MKAGRRRQGGADHIDLCDRDLGAHELRESLSSVLSAEHQKSYTLFLANNPRACASEEGISVIVNLIANTIPNGLHLGNTGINSKGAEAIATALKENGRVRKLWMKRNPEMRLEGAMSILNAVLSIESHLTSLDFFHCDLGVEGALAFSAALKHNKTIERLFLGGNNFGAEGAKAMAILLSENTRLKHLSLDINNLTDEGLSHIADSLAQNKTLRYLCLKYNRFTARGILPLCDSLGHNTTLQTLILGWQLTYQDLADKDGFPVDVIESMANGIEEGTGERVGGKALAGLLRTNCGLTSMNLCRVGLDAEDASILLEALTANPHSRLRHLFVLKEEVGEEMERKLKARLAADSGQKQGKRKGQEKRKRNNQGTEKEKEKEKETEPEQEGQPKAAPLSLSKEDMEVIGNEIKVVRKTKQRCEEEMKVLLQVASTQEGNTNLNKVEEQRLRLEEEIAKCTAILKEKRELLKNAKKGCRKQARKMKRKKAGS